MTPSRRTVALLTLAVPAAWMLAVLQADVTNVTDYSASIVRDYADGTIGDHWTDGVPPIIWKARVLVRGLILGLTAVVPYLTVETANLIVQAGFVLGRARGDLSLDRSVDDARGRTVRVGRGGGIRALGISERGLSHQLPVRPSDHLLHRCRTGGNTLATI